MKSAPLLLALALLPLTLSGTDLPDLGGGPSSEISVFEERRIAEQMVRELRRSGEVLPDIEIADYIDQLGYKLVSASNDNRINFRFFPIRDRQVNAFAIPGGVIGVNQGLIVLSQQESELAAVLAHEVAHVTQHHYARMLEAQKGTSIATLGAMALAILAARSSPQVAEATVAASQGVAVQRYLDFSRDFEREADRIGMRTLQQAGFDPRAMPTFFDRMQRYYRHVDTGAFAFLRTHPVTSERIADSTGRVEQLPYRQWQDSLDFLLVREKARVLQLGRAEALAYYTTSTREKKYANAAAQFYGYALAQWQAGQKDAAWETLQEARKRLVNGHPMAESLAGTLRTEQKRYAEAAKIYAEARQRFPSAPALVYGEIDLALQQGQLSQALALVQVGLSSRSADPGLHKRLADVQAQMGNGFASHRATAEYYALLDEPTAAIEQLQIARNIGGDYYEMSALEARLKTLRNRLEALDEVKK